MSFHAKSISVDEEHSLANPQPRGVGHESGEDGDVKLTVYGDKHRKYEGTGAHNISSRSMASLYLDESEARELIEMIERSLHTDT